MTGQKELEKELESMKFELIDTVAQLEKIIDLVQDSAVLDSNTQLKTAAFLEGYRTGLQEQIEWLRFMELENDKAGI